MLKLDALELSARMRTYRTRPVAPVKPRGQIEHLTKHVGVDVWEPSFKSVHKPSASEANKAQNIDSRSRLKPRLNLRKIPTSSDTPTTCPASFSVVNDATASLSPDKTTITSSLALTGEGEVLCKSNKSERIKLNIESYRDRAEYEAKQSSGPDIANGTSSHQEIDLIPSTSVDMLLDATNTKEDIAHNSKEDQSLAQKNAQPQLDNQSKLSLFKSKYLSINFFKNYALYGMAIFIFLIGLVAVFRSLMVDHKIAQVVSAQESKNSDNDDQSAADVDEQKPSTDKIASYSVAPDMPKLITIDKLGIRSRIRQLNTKPDGSLDAPKNIHDSGWYTQSAKPGSPGGASIIDGHVSGPTQKGVFYKIETLSPGDLIVVELGNGTKVEYSVVKTEVEKADTLNMSKLLLPVVQGKAGLNLITCTGKFDSKTQKYEDRGIVYAQFERMY